MNREMVVDGVRIADDTDSGDAKKPTRHTPPGDLRDA